MHIWGKLVNLFGKLVHNFGKLVHIFGRLVHISAWKLVSRTSKQVSRNLGPLWQPGFRMIPTNGAFQTVFFRFLTSARDRGKLFQRDKECLKPPVFSNILVPFAAWVVKSACDSGPNF